jgi:hypothetical protein
LQERDKKKSPSAETLARELQYIFLCAAKTAGVIESARCPDAEEMGSASGYDK